MIKEIRILEVDSKNLWPEFEITDSGKNYIIHHIVLPSKIPERLLEGNHYHMGLYDYKNYKDILKDLFNLGHGLDRQAGYDTELSVFMVIDKINHKAGICATEFQLKPLFEFVEKESI